MLQTVKSLSSVDWTRILRAEMSVAQEERPSRMER